jgi:hypothetical protein
MKRSPLLVAAAVLALFASCYTADTRYNHWRLEGLTPRVAYHFLRYDTNSGVPYYEHANQQRQDINLTIRRHLLNDNPYNPFQRKSAWHPPQKQFSPLPDPIHFFHLSSVALGAAFLGGGGPFFVFPIEVIPVLFEDGGWEEMTSGVRSTLDGEPPSEPTPPPVSEFRVKNA